MTSRGLVLSLTEAQTTQPKAWVRLQKDNLCGKTGACCGVKT